MFRRSLPVLCLMLSLCACGDDKDARDQRDAQGNTVDALPRPQGASGSVTGMPDAPGPGQVGPPGTGLPADAAGAEASDALPAEEVVLDGEASASPDTGPLIDSEPGPQDAVALVRDYYAAINAGDFGNAHALWADGGTASRQTPQQFAAGFTDTTGVSVQIDEPGRVGAAAGSRYIEVPVSIDAKQRDGSVRQYVGAYTLRRSTVDGASAEQRRWRIASADIREVRP